MFDIFRRRIRHRNKRSPRSLSVSAKEKPFGEEFVNEASVRHVSPQFDASHQNGW